MYGPASTVTLEFGEIKDFSHHSLPCKGRIPVKEHRHAQIAKGVRAVIDGGQPPVEVWAALMARRARPEVD